MATMVRDLIERARSYVRPYDSSDAPELISDMDNFLERPHAFYVERAVEHGGMAVYYLKDEIPKHTDGRTPAISGWQQEWDVNHAVINAREAWHYASMLGPYWVQQEIERQAQEAHTDALLEF